jgi:hypothetical protein
MALAGQGRHREAEAEYRKALRLRPDFPAAYVGLGTALLWQGDPRARAALQRGQSLLGPKDPGRLLVAVLVKQAERLVEVDRKLTAVLEGKAKPAGAAEAAVLADLARKPHRGLVVTSAHMYRQAFKDEPKLAGDLRAGHRYYAACAAALAGCGRGADAGKLDAAEKARWRQQALAWLAADVAAGGKQLKSWWPREAEQARQVLAWSKKDPDLAGVRDREGLAKLPEAERAGWAKLWAEVDSLLAPTPK